MPLRPRSLALLLAATLGLAGCQNGPYETPLPDSDELRAEFGVPGPGAGVVRESEHLTRGRDYAVAATYERVRVGESTQFIVTLRSDEPALEFAIRFDDMGVVELRADREYGATFDYDGEGPGGDGDDVVEITAVQGDRFAGVFAVDTQDHGSLAGYNRFHGAFHAVPAPE